MHSRYQRPFIANLVCTCLFWSAFQWFSCNAGSLSLRMVHKFSTEARDLWSRRYGDKLQPWPSIGSRQYFEQLYKHDHARHSRRLITYQSLYFSSGNETMNYGEQLGWLHYAVLDIGTPESSFLVALDTGSDLLWVPCECKQCAPTSSPAYGLDKKLNIYSPSTSNTSKPVTCSNSLCDLSTTCKSKNADCPYVVQYLSDNTSTSGTLVEDVIYLTSGNEIDGSTPVKTPVIFGCGQVQSGGFLDGGAPDGLLGLGLGDVSVPNFLAKAGLVENTFSMCFQPDNSGRIFFGDKGNSNQQTTSFLPLNNTYAVYIVAVEQIVIGSAILEVTGLEMLIDSGTSFTYLPSEIYSALTKKFDSQLQLKRSYYPGLPWNFCFETKNTQSQVNIPSLSLVFHGGGNFSVYSPLVGLYDENGTLEAFCLGVLEGEIAILGQNFMTSYRLVFDRENLKLGWSASDCYKLEEENGFKTVAPSPTMPGTETPMKASPSSHGHASAPKYSSSPALHGSSAPAPGFDQPPSGKQSSESHTRLFPSNILWIFVLILTL